MFDAETYRKRREEVGRAVGKGLILFLGAEEQPVNFAANAYPFRQDSSFLYFAGIDTPGLRVLLDIDEGVEFLIGRPPDPDAAIWTGIEPSLESLAAPAGIDRVIGQETSRSRIHAALNAGRKLHYLPPYRADQVLELVDLTGLSLEKVRASASHDLVRAVVSQRSRKSPEEVSEVETALGWTAELFGIVARGLAPGRNVLEIAGSLDQRVREWATRMAFPLIMTPHGEILHGRTEDIVPGPSDLLLVDMGVESLRHYASDVTRTFPAGGRFSNEQRDIYRIVLGAQTAAIASAAPGVPFIDIHREAALVIARGLRDMGLMKGDPESAVEAGAHALFFPHGLGHLLGLDVHDMESLGEDSVGYDAEFQRDPRFGFSNLRFGRRLETGQLLTIEPGVYFIPVLIDRWAAERRFEDFIDYNAVGKFRSFGGVRLEDDILVTESGCRILGPPIPRSVETIEALVGDRRSMQA
ncbi:MAG: aminopeptidase P family protein [Desulfobacterales bacterium]